jgi:hypothetical protein
MAFRTRRKAFGFNANKQPNIRYYYSAKGRKKLYPFMGLTSRIPGNKRDLPCITNCASMFTCYLCRNPQKPFLRAYKVKAGGHIADLWLNKGFFGINNS